MPVHPLQARYFHGVKKMIARIPKRFRNRYRIAVFVLIGWIAGVATLHKLGRAGS